MLFSVLTVEKMLFFFEDGPFLEDFIKNTASWILRFGKEQDHLDGHSEVLSSDLNIRVSFT